MMLMSFVNMKLRDGVISPMDGIGPDDLNIDRHWLEEKLGAVGMEYSPEHNKFW